MKPNRNPLRTLIYTCWSMLIICFVLQLLGGDWFNISTDNEILIKICNYVDQCPVLKYFCICAVSLTLNTFTALAILGQKKFTKLQMVLYIPTMLLLTVASHMPIVLAISINIVFLIVLPILQIDSIIMVILYYLYSIPRKEVGT